MELKNKVMKLYEDILKPVKARKIVLLLKYVIVDEETDLNRIKMEIPITEVTIKKYVNDDLLMLEYLTEEELKTFRSKINKLLSKDKLETLIELVLVKNETDISRIEKLVPITIGTIRKYTADKELLSKYLTEEQMKLFLTRLEKTNPKLQRLIKVVMVDGETNLDVIEKKAYIKIDTIKKHLEDTTELKKYLTDLELKIFQNKLNEMLTERENRLYKEEVNIVRKIIDDIFNTRYLYGKICERNFLAWKKFESYLNNEEFMNKEFPQGTVERVRQKIKQNDSLRRQIPRDCFVIEDRFCIMISRKDIHYLNQFDTKKLNFVSHYLGTGANLDLVMKQFETGVPETLAILSDAKLEKILDEKYYNVLKQCLNIENILLGNDLNAKKEFAIAVTNFLEQNNFDIKLAMLYFQIPEPLFNKVLSEIIKLPYASVEAKETIKSVLNIESEKKVK